MDTVEVAKNAARVRWAGHQRVKHHRACIDDDVWRLLAGRFDCYVRGKYASLAIKHALDSGLDFGLEATRRAADTPPRVGGVGGSERSPFR